MHRTGKAALLERAARVRLVLFDVDGVLTDGRLLLGDRGQEYKAFHTRDVISKAFNLSDRPAAGPAPLGAGPALRSGGRDHVIEAASPPRRRWRCRC